MIPAFHQELGGRENFEFARRENFIRREDRIFLKLASAPHAEVKR